MCIFLKYSQSLQSIAKSKGQIEWLCPFFESLLLQVAVGKAHALMLTDEGVIYSWSSKPVCYLELSELR